MTNLARFTIAATPSSQGGYDVAPSATPELHLEASSTLVGRVTFALGRMTSGAPSLWLSNGVTTGTTVDAVTPSSTVTISSGIPGTRAPHLWEIICRVNGGTNPDGSVNPDYTFSRIIAMRADTGIRKILPGERAEYDPVESWAGAFNDLPGGMPVTIQGTTPGAAAQTITGVRSSGTIVGGVQTITGAYPVATYGPTVLTANPAPTYNLALMLPAPADNTSQIDYLMRAHGFQTTDPNAVTTLDESVIIRVTRNAANTEAAIVGGQGHFASPKLRVYVSGTDANVYVRNDPTNDWTWHLIATLAQAPFDGEKRTVWQTMIGTGSSWTTLFLVEEPRLNGEHREVSYTVRGKFSADGLGYSFIRAKGTFVLQRSNDTVTLVDHVTTWTDARIQVIYSSTYCRIQMERHATENWIADAEMTSRLIGT